MPPRTAAVRRRDFSKCAQNTAFPCAYARQYAQKREQPCACCSLFLWPLFYELGLNLGNLLVYLIADELHKVQKEFPVGYLEDVLLAI